MKLQTKVLLSKKEPNEDEETLLRIENTGTVRGTPTPENNLLCKAHLNSMWDDITHEENAHNKNKYVVIMQLDEKFLTEKKLTLKDADEKKE